MTVKTQATAAPGKYWARLCALPKFSFILSAAGGVARAQDSCGNWVEASAVQQIVDDAESRIAELEAAAKCLHQGADAAHDPALEKPEAGRYVLAWTEGAKVPIRAMWAPQFFLEMADDDAESGEYSEAKDQYFCPEGWYENNAHEETHWNVDRPVIAWMELPRLDAALQAAPPAPAAVAVPEGWAWVPRNPTLAMMCAAVGPMGRREMFRNMVDAAPADAPTAPPAQEHATQLAGQGQECGVCGSDEAFTGTCGGGRTNSRALCFQGAAPAQAQEDARDAESAGRTDAEIVEQTEELAKFLLAWKWGLAPESASLMMRNSQNTKAQKAWNAACEIQELLTATDVENAVSEVDDAARAAQGGA